MERDESTRYVSGRTSLWCPICGASAGQGCKEVGGLRFASHDAIVLGTVPRLVVAPWEAVPQQRVPGNRPKWTPQKWVQ